MWRQVQRVEWGGLRVGVPRSPAQPGAEPKCAPPTGAAHPPPRPHPPRPPGHPTPSSSRPLAPAPLHSIQSVPTHCPHPPRTLDHTHPASTAHSTQSRPRPPLASPTPGLGQALPTVTLARPRLPPSSWSHSPHHHPVPFPLWCAYPLTPA